MIIKQTLIFANLLCNSKQAEQPRGQNYNAEGGWGGGDSQNSRGCYR